MILFLKHKWFDMIVSGEKDEEYREYKKFYTPRLLNLRRNFDKGKSYIELRRGYSKTAIKIECESVWLYSWSGDLFHSPETVIHLWGDVFPTSNIFKRPEWGFDSTKETIIFKFKKAGGV